MDWLRIDQIILARPENADLVELWANATGPGPDLVACYGALEGSPEVASGLGAWFGSYPPRPGCIVARPGAGAAAVVQLERVAAPQRLALTDDPRQLICGALGMLTVPVSRSVLAEALDRGAARLPLLPVLSVDLKGRLRPMVHPSDVALSLLPSIQSALTSQGATAAVLEFGGSFIESLSVPERAALAELGVLLGGCPVLFPSDERTEAYLREQKRSKAFRQLHAEKAAPFATQISFDVTGVEPMLIDSNGQARSVRSLEGHPLGRVVLGGGPTCSLRDLVMVLALLKSRQPAPHVDFVIQSPSRQATEVLAASGMLAELIDLGARLLDVSPDGALAQPQAVTPGHTLTTGRDQCQLAWKAIGTSPETLGASLARGEVADPRSAKKPVRFVVPRQLSTADLFLSKHAGGASRNVELGASTSSEPPLSEDGLSAVVSSGVARTSPDSHTSPDIRSRADLSRATELGTAAPTRGRN